MAEVSIDENGDPTIQIELGEFFHVLKDRVESLAKMIQIAIEQYEAYVNAETD
jgi:hypothetical protein